MKYSGGEIKFKKNAAVKASAEMPFVLQSQTKLTHHSSYRRALGFCESVVVFQLSLFICNLQFVHAA